METEWLKNKFAAGPEPPTFNSDSGNFQPGLRHIP
jgi:hypothetical protein